MAVIGCGTILGVATIRPTGPLGPNATNSSPKASEKTKKPISADTHRNILAQVKSFLGYCVARGWLRENPCAAVKGIGKRRPRGKSLGKDGNT